MTDRGLALLSVLFLLVGALVGSATLFFTIFLDARSTSNASAAAEALYAADAGIQRVRASLGRAPDFAGALGWPNGEPPFGALVWFPRPPRTYRVGVAPGAGATLVVTAEGTSHRGTRSHLQATFRRDPLFRPPSTVVLGAALAQASVAGSLSVDAPGVTGPPPAVGAETETVANAWLAISGTAAAVVGDSGFDASLDDIRASADQTLTGPFPGATWGSPAQPLVTHVIGNADVTGDVDAFGIVLADVPLRVTGRLEVDGLLLAAAGIFVDGELEVTGGVWATEAFEIPPGGDVALHWSPAALDAAGGLRPAALPRDAVLGGWRELW